MEIGRAVRRPRGVVSRATGTIRSNMTGAFAKLVLLWAIWEGLSARSIAQSIEAPFPLPPEEAARAMVAPEGFRVTLFAGEPHVRQPIAFCVDDRGRLWVAEAYNYPNFADRPADRILIFSDDDGDGKFDRRQVFIEGLHYVTGVEVGFGGVWIMATPRMLFVPDRDGDDRPDGEPITLLDGFGDHANSHNLANGFAWGPDGWLYGTHGRTNWSMLGKPGDSMSARTRFDGGVYRYHPTRHVWEPYADGTTNPWGIDWNDRGEAFVCNCVDPHLFHVIQGGHYEPWRNRDSSRFAYERIATIADHRHFIGIGEVRGGLGSPEEDQAGGGHAHCGLLVYLGDQWPEKYRDTVLMNNIHGRRINNDLPRRKGSGYVASHGQDLVRCGDPWYMGVVLQQAPDGAVYASDWSDTGECHSVTNTRRGTGRVFKISYGDRRAAPIDLARLSDRELWELQSARNEWLVRHARRLLQERAARGELSSETREVARTSLSAKGTIEQRLRWLWAAHAIGETDETVLALWRHDPEESARAWAIRLALELGLASAETLADFDHLAEHDRSPLVVMHLASQLQRLRPTERWPIAERLIERGEFADDANIPLLIWYAIEPLVHDDADRFVALADRAVLPLARRHIARRIAEDPALEQGWEALTRILATEGAPGRDLDLLEGALKGLEGVRGRSAPAGWDKCFARLNASEDARTRAMARRLALVFDDPRAQKILLSLAKNRRAAANERNQAIADLVAKRVAGFDETLLESLADPTVRSAALRGLAAYDHPATARAILSIYADADTWARQDAMQTLASKAKWAQVLLDGVAAGAIPRSDMTAFTARQIATLGEAELTTRAEELWGSLRETSAEKTRSIEEFAALLNPKAIAAASRSAGRAVFVKNCANCHRIFDAGESVGPDLTGAQRTNVRYLLLNLVDPSAAIARDFRMEVVETSAGRVVTGLVVAESDRALTIRAANESLVIPRDEIESRETSPMSMMPEGILRRLSTRETLDLFSYLVGDGQVAADIESSAKDSQGKEK